MDPQLEALASALGGSIGSLCVRVRVSVYKYMCVCVFVCCGT